MKATAPVADTPSARTRANAVWRARGAKGLAANRPAAPAQEAIRRLAELAADVFAPDDEAAAIIFLAALISAVTCSTGRGATPSRILVQSAAALALHWFPDSAILELLGNPLPHRQPRLSVVPTDTSATRVPPCLDRTDHNTQP